MSFVSPIFNRPRRRPHVFNDDLDRLKNGGLVDAAMAANIMYDHRVGPVRERALVRHWRGRPKADPDRLQNAQVDYFKALVRDARVPTFQRKHNAANKVFDGAGSGDLQATTQLVWILDLNGLDAIFKQARLEKWKSAVGSEPFKNHSSAGPDSDELRV